jgi:hypothetical protein
VVTAVPFNSPGLRESVVGQFELSDKAVSLSLSSGLFNSLSQAMILQPNETQ